MVRPFGSIARTWKALAAVVAMALVAVVLIATPGSATFAKKYDLVMSSTPSPITVGTSATVTATFTNKSLYSIGKVTLAVPSSKYTITLASSSSGPLPVITGGGTGVSVTGLTLLLNKPYTITMTVAVACDGATGSWGSTAKTSGGTSFSLNNAGNAQKTSVSGSCIGPPDTVTEPTPIPSSVVAGGTLDTVTVTVKDSNGNPVPNTTVSLDSNGLVPTSQTAQTDANGVATFSGLTATTTAGDYSMTATAGGKTSDPVNFSVTAGDAAGISFSTQPTDTQTGNTINEVTVHVTDNHGNAVSGATVDMTIGANPPGDASLTGTTSVVTGGSGNASFTDLQIATTSSGYTLLATSGALPTAESDPFAITNSDPDGCQSADFTGDCTATFDDGHTVAAPTGTTLIIETNQNLCSAPSLNNAIAGTVTIIPPSGDGPYPIQFDDEISFPIEGYYPFCKTSTENPGGADVDLCPNANGEPAAAAIPCVQQAISAVAPNPPTLHSVLWITNVDPIGRH